MAFYIPDLWAGFDYGKISYHLQVLCACLKGTGNATLSDLADQLAAILAQLDVALSTRASEATIVAILAKMDNPADPMVTEDLGTHTNPELFKVNNSFRSAVIARAGGIATALWTIATTPARTAGLSTYLYWVHIYNPTAGQVTGWLEVAGAPVTITFVLAAGQTATIDLPTVSPLLDNDVNCNASANLVEFQIGGYER